MKLFLHGATSGSNFGDFLFADLFLRKLKEVNPNGENIFFEFSRFGIGSHFRGELAYTHKQTLSDLKKADALILFSGGYFGERENSIKENILRFVRYVPLSMWFILKKKPIIISGVGGGPLSNKILRKSMSFIMKKALFVTVRDVETKGYFNEYGVTRDIKITSDTAQIITEDIIPPLNSKVKSKIGETLSTKKKIFFHLYGKEQIDNKLMEKIIPPLNEFLSNNKDFGVVVGFDWTKDVKTIKKQVLSVLNCEAVYFYQYEAPWQFCSLLNTMDFIITPKLHVGIVGATLSKSVISMPMHKEKTARYYKQIDESGRCISLEDSTYKEISDVIKKYHNKNINLPEEIKNLSKYNLDILENIITTLDRNDF